MKGHPLGLYSMRSSKDAVLFRIASAAYTHGLTPNILTTSGLALGLTCGTLFALHVYPLAFTFGVLSVFCDVLDGTIARKFHMESKFGMMFDSTADRLTELAVVLGALAGGIIQPIGVVAVIGSVALFASRFASYRRGLKTDYALFGRFERLIFILVGLLSPVVWVSTVCFVIAGTLSLVSSIQIAGTLYRHKK